MESFGYKFFPRLNQYALTITSPFNISKDEFESLCKLKNENNLVTQKTDQGKSIVILDKDSYLKSVETFLKDSSKFKNIPVTPDKDLNYVINSEKEVTDLLKKIKNKNAISEETYNKLRSVGSEPETLYGSAKVHKPLKKWITTIQIHSFSDWYLYTQISKIFSSRCV